MDVNKAIKQLNDKWGENTISLYNATNVSTPRIRTGVPPLDETLGGGLPEGRIIEIYGPESSGKTTLALHCLANAQKEGDIAFLDMEHALDPDYAQTLGVDTDKMYFAQPSCAEEVLEITEMLLKTEKFKMIVIDSVAAMVPKAELDGDMGEMKMGLHARLMSQACRKLTGQASKAGTILLFINQIRQKIGVVYGNPEVTTGGLALKYYSTVRLEVRRNSSKSTTEGTFTNIKVAKSKVSRPLVKVESWLQYGEGFSYARNLLKLAITKEIVNKKGSWYSFNDIKIQGEDSFSILMEDNEELTKEIEDLIYNK